LELEARGEWAAASGGLDLALGRRWARGWSQRWNRFFLKFKNQEKTWLPRARASLGESPRLSGRAVVALATRRGAMATRSGRVAIVAEVRACKKKGSAFF
jgi:hypothetical protein